MRSLLKRPRSVYTLLSAAQCLYQTKGFILATAVTDSTIGLLWFMLAAFIYVYDIDWQEAQVMANAPAGGLPCDHGRV